jgi:hypothetical protein
MHLDIRFMDRLVHAGLICAERAATLQHQRHALKRKDTLCAYRHAFR